MHEGVGAFEADTDEDRPRLTLALVGPGGAATQPREQVDQDRDGHRHRAGHGKRDGLARAGVEGAFRERVGHAEERAQHRAPVVQVGAAEEVPALPGATREAIRAVAAKAFGGFGAEAIAALPNLALIANFGVGYDNIDVAAAQARGVRVTNTPDVLTDDTADLAVGMLLALTRQIVRGDAYVRSGTWAREGAMALNHADAVALAAAVDDLLVTVPGGPETAQIVSREVLAALGADGQLVNIARGSP